jgi:hypothetical protein
MEEINIKNGTMHISTQINIKKNFIRLFEDFEKVLYETHKTKINDYNLINYFALTKNYISTIEFSKILNSNKNAFEGLTYINL